ncbi:MAG TPA: HD-GYP domain-containing protein, partial [Egibacteraceae bacterium]|nr:HD-GYP domain-containing protein [Egibacteraceae bacterium]
MTDDVPASQRWRGRPVHSLLVQAFIFAVPVVASVAAAAAVSAVGPRPRGTVELVAWWVVLTAIALAVLTLVDRLARRLLPLATLLKLSMLFPDRAPSRFRVARNAASVRKLSEQLAQARERGLTAEPVWAAETVLTLITALGHHDRRSRGHSERVHVYAELLADELDLPQADRDRLRWAALLHDVGKLIVPAEVLNKPADPDDGEWQALRRHPEAGAELCAPLLPWLGEWGAAIAQHHEWFDGTGYPRGLKGHEISRAARIVAVADCYEVMTTSRTYKRALSPAAAREELARCAGTQFDPAIVRAFLNVSLGRLRLAMGPLAVLATVPSMARLTSWLEPVARAGAVIGGAALIMGSSGVWQTPGAAEAASRPVAPATTPVVATVDVGVPPEKALPR